MRIFLIFSLFAITSFGQIQQGQEAVKSEKTSIVSEKRQKFLEKIVHSWSSGAFGSYKKDCDNTIKRPEIVSLSKTGKYHKVTQLIESCADVNYQNKKGNTALILASIFERPEIVSLLLRAGANIDHESKDGITPLI